jgi:hypothetical protein
MASNEAKIKLTAEDATAAAFGSVLKNVTNLKTEVAGLPAKFTQIAIASAGIGSIAGFASMISQIIDGRAKLRDLSIETNISVEALSGLAKIAKLSDTPLETVTSASTKLSKALFSQTEDSKGAAAAIQALGLNFDKFKSQSPDQQLYDIAKALDSFQDGAEKSGAAMLLFGKNGAEILPFLRELSEQGLQVGKVTSQQAEEARKYEQNLRALKMAGEEWKKTLADDMLPTLKEFSQELLAGRQAYGSWFGALVGIGTTNPFASMGDNIVKARDDVKDLEAELTKSKGGRLTRPESVIESELGNARKKYDYFLRLQRMQASALADGVYEDPRLRTAKPKLVLPDANTADSDALLAKIFQGQIKAIKDGAEQQKDALDYANKYLKGSYDDGLLALSDYYDEQSRLRAVGVAEELESIDKEVAAAKKLRDSAAKPETRQQAENAIADATARRAKLVQKSAQDNVLATQEEEKAVKQLAFTYYDFLANTASLTGDELGAAALKRVKQVQDAQELLTKIGFGKDEAKARADAYGLLLEHIDKLRVAQSDYSRIVDTLGLREKEISLDAEASGASELDTLKAIGAERAKQLPLLQAMADKAMQEAQAIGSPDAILAAQKLQVALKQAAAEVDPIFMKIRDIGKEMGEAIASDAENAIVHWQGVRNLLNAIETDILRIATRKLFTEPFGNFLSNEIGGNGQASGGGGILGTLFSKAFGLGGAGASGGQSVWGGSSDYGGLSQLPNFGADFLLPGLATGTNYVPQDMLTMVHEGEAVVPKQFNPAAGGSGGGRALSITVNPPAGMSRQSASQFAAQVGDQISDSVRRYR